MLRHINKSHKSNKSDKAQDIWLYLYFPLLSLETLLPQVPADQAHKPIATVSLEKNIQRVLCCNTQAGAWGVESGLSVSTALALCPELLVLPRKIEQEQQHLQQLALLAYSFRPVVILDNDTGLWLEISGCNQLFKGYNALLQALEQRLLYEAITAVNGIGQNPLAAKLLCQPSFQTQLPKPAQIQHRLMNTDLSCLETSRKQQQSFEQLGLKSLGDLLALSRSALSRRFDGQLMAIIQQLKSEKPFTATPFQPANIFHDVVQNPQGIFNKESLLFPMKGLLQRLCQYLTARQCHCLEIEWRFEPLIGEPQKMQMQLSGSQNNWSSCCLL